MTTSAKAHSALLGTNIFFAINYTTVKFLVNNDFIQSFGLNLVRVGICSILLWIVYIFKPVKSPILKKDYGRFFLCALSGIAINQLLFLKGLSLTYSIHASLLMLGTPIFITILAALVLKERPGILKILGLILGITGALVLITAKEISGNAKDAFTGDILVLLNAISYAVYFILVKPLMKTYPPITVIRMIFTIGFFLILPFCWVEFAAIPWSSYTNIAWLNLGLVVFTGTFLAYVFNLYGLKILGPAVAGTYIYSQPVFTAVIAMIFLKEELSTYKIVAALLIAAGVYLSTKQTKNA